MKRSVVISALAAAVLTALAVVSFAKSPPPKSAHAVGKSETAKWTSTTYEAAADEANKKVLAAGRPVTVTGEVVEVSCYLQLGKRGLAHVACGTKCINNGQPIGIVDAQDQLYLIFAEPHHPRRDGQAAIKDVFLPHLAQNIRVSGMMTHLRGGTRALFIEPAAVAVEGPAK